MRAAGARLGNGVARVAEMVPRPQKLRIECRLRLKSLPKINLGLSRSI